MPNVIHFDIGVDNLEAAATFYSKVFGWKIEKTSEGPDYWSVTTGDEEDPGISGGLVHRSEMWDPALNSIEVYIDVPSLDRCARQITEAGGKVLTPKEAIPGLGYRQYCQDPENNVFILMEYDESAQ
jgi:predicted enzyme related to lactoylglutathione lyase